MKSLKRLIDFYIHSSIHVALAVYSLVRITENTLHFQYYENIESTVFYGTIVGYNFLKYFEPFQKGNFDLNKNRYLVGLTFLSIIGVIFYFIQLNNSLQIYFIKIGLIVALYPFLRKFGLWKLFLVSFCITAITVYAPIISQSSISEKEKIILFQRFFIVFALLIPFEILDSETDDKTLKTIPQRIGIWNTKMFGFVAIVFFLGIEFSKPTFDYISLWIGLITALAIWFSTTNRNDYYTSFWVECIPILWYIFYLILI
ncbi:hypothetical protein [Flavobacterium sp.]|uniref:hypothetical protein n=1 Tax=Flavobacterium sp. TaxID=239 RepID=UPI0025BAE324|nr:hypothetical protein [Flavobacterium sp.]MBA4154961.1 hypothetical protein [Flavobacterium sp.]